MLRWAVVSQCPLTLHVTQCVATELPVSPVGRSGSSYFWLCGQSSVEWTIAATEAADHWKILSEIHFICQGRLIFKAQVLGDHKMWTIRINTECQIYKKKQKTKNKLSNSHVKIMRNHTQSQVICLFPWLSLCIIIWQNTSSHLYGAWPSNSITGGVKIKPGSKVRARQGQHSLFHQLLWKCFRNQLY